METNIEQELELYKKMYHCLFNGITDAENLKSFDSVISFLKEKQLEAEEIYISCNE